MGMRDCERCWDTPCICGHDWRRWSPEALRKQAALLLDIAARKEAAVPPSASVPCVCGCGKPCSW